MQTTKDFKLPKLLFHNPNTNNRDAKFSMYCLWYGKQRCFKVITLIDGQEMEEHNIGQ